MPWLNKRWIVFFSAFAAVMVTVISILGWINFKAGVVKRDTAEAFGVGIGEKNLTFSWPSSEPALQVILMIDSFDPGKAGNTLGFHFEFLPINQLQTTNQTLPVPVPALPVQVLLGSITADFPAGVVMPDRSVSQMLIGDINTYPFDVYVNDKYTLAAHTSKIDPLHLTVYGIGTVQGFSVDINFDAPNSDGSVLRVDFTIRRSGTSKVFAIIIFIVMWCLSLSIFVTAISVWFRGKKVELPVIAISTGLLFALPGVRNSQPGLSAVAGTTSDMVGFFWNLLLVAISAVSLLIKYILQNKREQPKLTADPEQSLLMVSHHVENKVMVG